MHNNSDQGLVTKIWGPHLWITLHSISFGYPIKPTEDDKNNYLNFFKFLGDVLPCSYCRDSFNEFIITGNTKLTNETVKNRETLCEWLYLIHEAVNNKLGVNYGVSFVDVINKYEKFRIEKTNNLDPKYWSQHLWISLYCIGFGYPINNNIFKKTINENNRQNSYDKFFYFISFVIPHKRTRLLFSDIINKIKINLNSRDFITRWLYDVISLICNTTLSFSDTQKKYESYRAKCSSSHTKQSNNKKNEPTGCIIPLNKFLPEFIPDRDCPIIPYELAKKFIKYAKIRNISDNNIDDIKNGNDIIWKKRNSDCSLIIYNMRKNNLDSIEKTGIWKGLLSIPEIMLVMKMSSTLSIQNLVDISHLLEKN
jgi:hypothetical protein